MKKISNEDSWAGVLRDAGFRLTMPRRAVIRVLSEHREGLAPEDIRRLGRETHPSLGLVTVYRTLELFENLGIVRRIHLPGRRHCFCAGRDDTHFAVCSRCGRVTEFPCPGTPGLYGHVRAETGYAPTDHILEVSGVCPVCARGREGCG